MIKQAVILVGGLGTRLGALTKFTPKPMLKVHGKPFVYYLVKKLKRQGIQNIILSTGYYGDQFFDFFGDGSDKFKQIVDHPNAIFIDDVFTSAKNMSFLAQLAFDQKQFEDVAYFEPFYLKDFVAGPHKK